MRSGWAGAWTWARADLRSRWGSLLVLGLLAGVTSGLALASLAGSFRTATALDRFLDRTNAAHVVVFTSQVGELDPDWSGLQREPYVDEIARWGLLFGVFGEGAPPDANEEVPLIFGALDDRYLQSVDDAVVVEGRMFDPAAPTEVVIDERVPEDDLGVGDQFEFTFASPGEITEQPGAAPGPTLALEVVGRVRTPSQFLFTEQGVLASPGLVRSHGAEIGVVENSSLRLADESVDLAVIQRDVDGLVAQGTPVLDLRETARRVETTLSVERTTLLALAAAIAVAGTVLVGLAVSRSAGTIADDHRVLRAVGLSRSQLWLGPALSHLPVALVAVGSALLVASIASWWFPVGLAAEIDVERGFQATWSLFVPGVAALAVLVVGGTVLAAARAMDQAERPPAVGRGGFVSWVRRQAPLPVGIGTTLALDPGSGRSRVPVRPALAGACVGVLGVVAVVTLHVGLADALDHPERAGVAWDAQVVLRDEDFNTIPVSDELAAAVRGTRGVAAVGQVDRTVVDIDQVGVPIHTVRPLPRQTEPGIDLVTIEGRAPRQPGELTLGPKSADDLGVGIGERVRVAGSDQEMRVVGLSLFPAEVHAQFDEGAWLLPADFDRAVASEEGFEPEVLLSVQFEEGLDHAEGIRRLETAAGGLEVTAFEPPVELANLGKIRRLPGLLAWFLAALATLAVGHVLFTSTRRRRHEFAVLRALGLTRWGARSVLNSQGTAIALVGLAVGVPVGIAVGRAGWSRIAQSVPLVEIRPFAAVAVLLVAAVTVLLANLLALWPGRRAARARPAEILRAE